MSSSWKSTCTQLLPFPQTPCNRQSALPSSPPASGPSCHTLLEHPSSSCIIRQTRCSPSSTSRISPSLFWDDSLMVFVQLLPVVTFSLFQCRSPKSRLSPLIGADDHTISHTLLCVDDFHNHISSTDLSPELQACRSNSLPDIPT